MGADDKFFMAVQRKNKLYNECRELTTALGISYTAAKKEFLEHHNPIARDFHRQFDALKQFETEHQPADYEYIDPPISISDDRAKLLTAFDPFLTTKSHGDVRAEEALLRSQGIAALDGNGVRDDLKTESAVTAALDAAPRMMAQTVMDKANGTMDTKTAIQSAAMVHRGNPTRAMYRSPGVIGGNMNQHPEHALERTFQMVDDAYTKQYGRPPRDLVNVENDEDEEDEHDYDDDDDDDDEVIHAQPSMGM